MLHHIATPGSADSAQSVEYRLSQYSIFWTSQTMGTIAYTVDVHRSLKILGEQRSFDYDLWILTREEIRTGRDFDRPVP
jgi:hypothetical protein